MKVKILLTIFFFFVIIFHSHADSVCLFEGNYHIVSQQINIKSRLGERAVLDLAINKNNKKEYFFSSDATHLDLFGYDFSSIVVGSVNFLKSKILVKIFSRHSLFEYKPIRELSGKFEIRDRELNILDFSFGNISLTGAVGLREPNDLELTLFIRNIDMEDFLDFWIKERAYFSSGDVSGSIKITGNLKKLHLKGDFESHNGFVKNLWFDSIRLRLEGDYPKMMITDSIVSETDGNIISISGPFDLSAKNNFKKQIEELVKAPIITTTGLQKEWTLKRQNQNDSSITEIKYLKRRNSILNNDSSESKDMFGLQKTLKF